MGSLIRATNLRGFNELVTSLGGRPEKLLKHFHIPPDLEEQTDAFMPFRQLALLLEASAEDLACPDFALRLADWQGMNILGPIAVVMRNADTVLSALQDVGQYLHVHSPALSLSVLSPDSDDSLWFRYQITEPRLPLLAQSYELSMANVIHILRMLGGHATVPLAMHFLHAPVSTPETYRERFGCPVHFRQAGCGFQLSREQLALPIDKADSETHRLAVSYLSSFHAPGTTLATRVIELIRALLPTGQCRIDTVADQLALHPRTLQRRLTQEQESFDLILDEQRRQLAARYLAENGLHLAQITGLLGYAEQSSLNRACRRWFGETPKAHRMKLSPKDN